MSKHPIVDKQYVIDRFNALVTSQLNPGRNSAAYSSSNPHGDCEHIAGHGVWGPRNEPMPGPGDIPGEKVDLSVFTALNNIAKRFAYVRVVYWTTRCLGNVGYPEARGPAQGHVSAGYGNPGAVGAGAPVAAGDKLKDSDFDNFLNTLRGQVNGVRASSVHLGEICGAGHCHCSCHSACHGSRGRR